ncbi:sensor histidine kinase [Haloimpatiens sp. FM7330]|uniref:sensor histidine kinase n=1 Tax=Haloimpatiens sp. FM7330 TaxID=3298610 RepID=UPI00362536C0
MFNRITKKLIKYFLSIMLLVILICFIGSSFFLSKFYLKSEYDDLQSTAKTIHVSLKEGYSYENINVHAFLIKDGLITPVGRGKMKMMGLWRNVDFSQLSYQGTIKLTDGQQFLYSKLNTEFGELLVLKNFKSSSDYLKFTYIILLCIFLITLIISIPLIYYMGKKFTDPILYLKNISNEIAHGNFNTEINVNTNDEIEDLSHSLKHMSSNLEKEYKMQREFIANVSHDFKTPLSIIRNYSEAITDGMVIGDEAKEYSNEIIKEVDRLNSLIISIIQLSKLQGGNLNLNKKYFNINTLLKECTNKFKYIAHQKKINLILHSQDTTIYGDENYILRVLYNFLDNALKFSKENSNITISTLVLEKYVKVSIIDNGLGIPKDIIDDIWNRYYKHNKKGGMGLGLAICSEILKLHNFKYGVNSIPNERTEFYFTAPISLDSNS